MRFIANNQLNEKQLLYIARNFWNVKEYKEEQIVNSKGQAKLKKTTELQLNTIKDIMEHKCRKCELCSYHITQFDTSQYYQNLMDSINKVLAGGLTDKEKEFNDRNELLMDYKMIDSDLNMLFKGKVMSICDDIIMTEFFFSGLVSTLTDVELLAILSLFCNNEKAGNNAKDCSKIYSDQFEKALDFVWEETEKLIENEKQKSISNEDEQAEKRINQKFYEMVYDWAD